MGTQRTRATIVGLGVLTLAVTGLPAGQATAATPTTPSSALRVLVKQTNALPRTATTKARRARLVRTARHARRIAAKRPCLAVRDLDAFRRTLRTTRTKKGRRFRVANRRLAGLGPASTTASRLLLNLRRTKRCGGAVTQPKVADTTARVLRSDAGGMRVRVDLPPVRFAARSGGGKVWTQISLPDTDAPGRPGTPAIPVTSSTLAVPEGAKLEVDTSKSTSYEMEGVDLFPVQPDVVDAVSKAPNFLRGPFAARPFTFSPAAYRRKGLVPRVPADGEILGRSRDLRIGAIQIPAARYDPRRRVLRVLTSVEVKVTFEGGSHTFSDELASPWERPQQRVAAALINRDVIGKRLDFEIRRCGMEMLVITNPATRPAADQFSAARNAAGIRTHVVETGSGSGQIGTAPAQIQSYIRARLTSIRCIRPSYVTILGDDDLVPTFPGVNSIPSDLPYSLRDNADELPDVAVGRILGNDQAAVGTAVTKIVGYETTAPTGGGMLSKALIAAQFQDDDNDGQENRTFIQFAETVRSGLVTRGVAVDRVYGEEPGSNPQRFNDGTDLPAALRKPTFGWNGTGAQVSADWNEGRFMVVHRDHGWNDGWGTPRFGTDDVNALSNGSRLPVVFSINCSSGAYDYDETSFASESLVKANGGSVGVFGDTRDSPSWHNTQIALGFVDALLPSVLPAEGPGSKSRTGDALTHGKLRLAGLAPPAGDGNTRNELYLWHYFGDPSMQMWGGGRPPRVFDLGRFSAVLSKQPELPNPGDPPPYEVNVTLPAELAGQPLSLVRDGEVVGRAIAGAGVATIPASFGDGSVKPGELRLAIDADDAQPVSVPVSVPADPAPPAQPAPPTQPPGPAATTLSQSCPASAEPLKPFVVTGTLSGAPAGSSVRVTATAPEQAGTPGRVVEQTVQTDAGSAWSASFTPGRGETGRWTVSSAYAGDAGHVASSTGPCTVPVGFVPVQ